MDTDFAKDRISEKFPCLPIINIESAGEGEDNIAFSVNDDLIFLFPKRNKSCERLKIRHALLPEVQKGITTKIPVFDFYATTEAGKTAFVGYKKIRGMSRYPKDLERDEASLHRALAQMAEFAAQLHAFPVERASEAGVPKASYEKRITTWLGEFKSFADGLVSPETMRFVESSFQRHLADQSNFAFKPTLVHSDLLMHNMLFDLSGNLSGVIDFGDLVIGNPEYDLVEPYRNFGQDNFREHFLPFYPHPNKEALIKKLSFLECARYVRSFCFKVRRGRTGGREWQLEKLNQLALQEKNGVALD